MSTAAPSATRGSLPSDQASVFYCAATSTSTTPPAATSTSSTPSSARRATTGQPARSCHWTTTGPATTSTVSACTTYCTMHPLPIGQLVYTTYIYICTQHTLHVRALLTERGRALIYRHRLELQIPMWTPRTCAPLPRSSPCGNNGK
jgi:hypothetical protein